MRGCGNDFELVLKHWVLYVLKMKTFGTHVLDIQKLQNQIKNDL